MFYPHLSRIQDNLVDYLRKNDAGQLPEVGLQVAATQLRLLQPNTARQLAADPEKFRHVVDMLCRLATQIQSLQKDRNEAVRKAAYRSTSEFMKRDAAEQMENLRFSFTGTLGESPSGPITPRRNELPKRDELAFRDPPPEMPSFLEILKHMNGTSHA